MLENLLLNLFVPIICFFIVHIHESPPALTKSILVGNYHVEEDGMQPPQTLPSLP
jgi:hypothetical protein